MMIDDSEIECVFCGFESDKNRITEIKVFEGALPLPACNTCYRKLTKRISGNQSLAIHKQKEIKNEKSVEVCAFLGNHQAVGWTLQRQADLLNACGKTTNRNKPFSRVAVKRCFDNEQERYEQYGKVEGQTYRENLKAAWPDDESL